MALTIAAPVLRLDVPALAATPALPGPSTPIVADADVPPDAGDEVATALAAVAVAPALPGATVRRDSRS